MEENVSEIQLIMDYWRERGAWTTKRRMITWGGMCESNSDKIQHERIACGNAVGVLPITWDGKVVNCVVDVDAQSVCGDVNSNTIKEIWTKRNKDMVSKHMEHKFDELPDICKNCTDWAIVGEERFDENGNRVEKNYNHTDKML